MTNHQKETRPAAAATVRDARKEVTLTTSDSTPAGASRQDPAMEEFLKTPVWDFCFEIESQKRRAKMLRDVFMVISEGLDENPNGGAGEYGSVAEIAWDYADKLTEDMEKTMTALRAYDMRRRALCGEVQG